MQISNIMIEKLNNLVLSYRKVKVKRGIKVLYNSFKNISLSALGMGNMRLPIKKDVKNTPIDRSEAQKIIDEAMAGGINYYDTAYVYHGGESEDFVGEAMAKHPRESYHLATKFSIFAKEDYKEMFEEQLKNLRTDYVDFYLIHCLTDENIDKYLNCGCIEYFIEQQRLGRIKYLGFSSHASVESLERFASHHDWDFAQLQINWFDWNYGTAKAEYEVLEKKNIPVIVMEPVRGGKLASLSEDAEKILKTAHPDWSIPAWAFRFVKSLPMVKVVLSGMSNLEQLNDNLNTFSDKNGLNDEDMQTLMTACEVFKKNLCVPCTACRYCCDECPAQIDIPAVLSIYNDYKVYGGGGTLRRTNDLESTGKPADCVECGLCKNHCPQNIDITAIMQEIKEKI